MKELDPKSIKKLRKLLLMLGSDQAGEAAAAVAAIRRTLDAGAYSLHDLVAMIDKPPRVIVEEKIVYRDVPQESRASRVQVNADYVLERGRLMLERIFLSDRERDFVENMLARAEADGVAFGMTKKQATWFNELFTRTSTTETGYE